MFDAFGLKVDPQDGLASMTFQIASEGVLDLLKALAARLGPGRSGSAKTMFGSYSHAYEWSTARYGVLVTFNTKDGDASSPVGSAAVRVQRGPFTESPRRRPQKIGYPSSTAASSERAMISARLKLPRLKHFLLCSMLTACVSMSTPSGWRKCD
jgi:hypothetical protein